MATDERITEGNQYGKTVNRAVQGCYISVLEPEGIISLVQWDSSICYMIIAENNLCVIQTFMILSRIISTYYHHFMISEVQS